MKTKIIVLLTTLALSVALFAVASAATGAYFSDSHAGAVTGTGGTIGVAAGVNADFGGGLAINWPNMLPGEVYSATVHYQNDGNAPQDVWMTFTDMKALGAINDLGAFGAVQILDSSSGQVFYSNNLNNHPDDQGLPGLDGRGVVWALRNVKLRSNLPVGSEGTMTFKFQYASKMTSGNGTGFAFNRYLDGTGSGLPYAIVGTQVGITPDNAGGWAGF